MIVVADSGPLHYLILLEQTDLLQRLYGAVLIPETVVAELSVQGAPVNVREWLSTPPAWLEVLAVTAEDLGSVTKELDLGERAAIAIAEFYERARRCFECIRRFFSLTRRLIPFTRFFSSALENFSRLLDD